MATSNGCVPMSGCNRWPSFDYGLWFRGGKTRLHLQFFFWALFGLFWVPAGRRRLTPGGRIFHVLPANDFF